jgi:dTDP-glucose pyrophosphorylase
MKIIILAAGIGKRMSSVTEIIPKPLLPINGIPIIDETLSNISRLGFKEVTIVINHLSELIKEYCGNGKRFKISIKYVLQDKSNGTGAAVKKALERTIDDVMIIGGDTLFTFDHFKTVFESFKNSEIDGLILLKKIPNDILARTSLVKINENNIITKFIEKPKLHQIDSNTGSALLHLYNRTFLKYLDNISISERGEYELTEATKKMIEDKKIIKGVLMPTPLDLTEVKDLLIHNFSYIDNLLKNKG